MSYAVGRPAAGRGMSRARPRPPAAADAAYTLAPFWVLVVCGMVACSIMWPRYAYLPMGFLPNMTITFVAMVAGCGLIVLRLLTDPPFSRRIGHGIVAGQGLFAALLVWYGWRFFCDIAGDTPPQSLMFTFREITDLSCLALAGAVVTTDRQARRIVFRTIAVCTLVAGLLGLYEFAIKRPLLQEVGGLGIGGAVGQSQLSYLFYSTLRDGVYRARSVFNHSIVFGQYMACMAPVMLYIVRYDPSRLFRLVALAAFGVIVPALYTGGSRSGYVIFAVGMAALFSVMIVQNVRRGGRGLIYAMVALVVLVAGSLASADFIGELLAGRTTSEASSNQSRQIMISRADRALEQSPIVGYGEGSAPALAGVIGPLDYVSLDSYVINVAVDYGYVGLVVAFGFIATWAFYTGRIALSRRVDPDDAGMAEALLASGFSLLSAMSILSITDNMCIFYFYIGLIWPIVKDVRGSPGTITGPQARAIAPRRRFAKPGIVLGRPVAADGRG